MKYIGLAQTAEELIKILEQLPSDATLCLSDYSVAEVWYDEDNNDIEIK